MPSTVSIPGNYDERFVRFFAWYVRRMFRQRFYAVHLALGTRHVLASVANSPKPLIVAMNHSSWWDPLVALLVGRVLCPDRSGCAPMDARMLAKFGMFRRLGIFGIDPDDARGLPALVGYVLERFEREARPTLWITPQGRFMDVREPVVLRPGVAAIAARAALGTNVVALGVEYAFWIDQKPEVFLRLARVEPPAPPATHTAGARPSTADWHRAIEGTMRDNAQALAALVRAREPAAFEPLIAGAASVHPVMDLWLRATGRGSELEDRTRTPTSVGAGAASDPSSVGTPTTKGSA